MREETARWRCWHNSEDLDRGQTLADRWQTSVMELAGRQQDGAAAHQGPGEGSGLRAWLELHLPAAGLEQHPAGVKEAILAKIVLGNSGQE